MIIIICIFICLILFVCFRFLKNKSQIYGKNVQNISLLAFINPFDSTIRKIYKSLSPENKGSFWSIVSNVSVCIFTFWLGLSIQYYAYNSAMADSTKLSHFQVVDKLKPLHDNLVDSCSAQFFNVFVEALSISGGKIVKDTIPTKTLINLIKNDKLESVDETPSLRIQKYLMNHNSWDDIIYTGNKCIESSSSIAPYLNSESNSALLKNNAIITIGMTVYDALQDSVPVDSIVFVKKCFSELTGAIANSKVSLNSDYKSISELAYSYYKSIEKYKHSSANTDEYVLYKVNMSHMFINLFAIPIWENVLTMKKEFSPQEETNIWYMTILILLICLLIGYIIFRFIIFRFFNQTSLSPGLTKEQKENERLNKVIDDNKRDIDQLSLNIKLLTNDNSRLEKEIKSLNEKLDELLSDKNNSNNIES